MLIDKGVGPNEVVTFKLTSGEELVARLNEETATHYKLSKPMVIAMGAKGPVLLSGPFPNFHLNQLRNCRFNLYESPITTRQSRLVLLIPQRQYGRL
jgi:hypothetical protein